MLEAWERSCERAQDFDSTASLRDRASKVFGRLSVMQESSQPFSRGHNECAENGLREFRHSQNSIYIAGTAKLGRTIVRILASRYHDW